MKRVDHPTEWIYRAVIIGLIGWSGSTLYTLDKKVAVIEFQIAAIEFTIVPLQYRYRTNNEENEDDE